MAEQILEVRLDSLCPCDGNRRVGGFDPLKLEQLAESIRAVGVQQPAVVRAHPNGPPGTYEIVAGERRWKASAIAGLETLPCVVREIDDVTVLKIQTIENLQREDIHPLDEADGYARLIDRAGYDVEHLAQEVGRSVSYVYQRLKLRDLIQPARKMLVEGKILAGHAILIARLPAGQQKELVNSWLFRRGEEVSVRHLEDYIHREVLLDLNKAAFKKDDSELDPQAGPCTTCPKRTGYQPALFADVCNGGKRDYCTDSPCFQGKLAALVQRRKYELEESGEPHLQVIDGYSGNYDEERRLVKGGVKEQYAWEECKKKDEGAVRCLVVAGRSPGRLTWGRERKQGRYNGRELTPEEKAERKARREAEKAAAALRQKAYERVLHKAAEQQAAGEDILGNPGILRVLASQTFERLPDQHRRKIQKLEQWPASTNWEERRRIQAEQLEAMDREALSLFVLKCLAISGLDVSDYGFLQRTEELLLLGKALGADVRDLDRHIQEKQRQGEARRARWDEEEDEGEEAASRRCRVCGCTDADCRQCIEKTGEPCHWVEEDLCSACADTDLEEATE